MDTYLTCAVAAVPLHYSTCNLPRRPNDSVSSMSLRTDSTHIIFGWRRESLSPLLFATETLSPSCRIPTSQCQSRASSRIAYLSNPQLLLQVFIQYELCRLTKKPNSSAFLLPLSTILISGVPRETDREQELYAVFRLNKKMFNASLVKVIARPNRRTA